MSTRPNRSDTHFGVAFGKVLLIGEHAVVYGKPALGISIHKGSRAAARRTPDEQATLTIPRWSLRVQARDASSDLGRAFAALLDRAHGGGEAAQSYELALDTELSPGVGLGCSASLGVAAARALAPHASGPRIIDIAMAWERVFHGNPSGVDVACAARGGCVWFQAGVVSDVVARGSVTLCIASSGVASPTKGMVEQVARRRAQERARVDVALDSIGALALDARVALESGDLVGLGRAMNHNHEVLCGLGVSSDTLDRLCRLARRAGALGAKLTGAGGGGCVVALAWDAEDAARILRAWREDGVQDPFLVRAPSLHAALASNQHPTPPLEGVGDPS